MNNPMMRELFIDELAQITGGSDPLEKVREIIRDIKDPNTTMACCEEGQCCDYWS